MARIVFFIAFLTLALSVVPKAPVFAGTSPYDVKGVEVDVLDESSVKARNKAFVEAQKMAFEKLAKRYLSNEEMKTFKLPPEEDLSGYIQDFSIAKEQISNKRYRGVFDFRFKSAATNKFFGHGPVTFEQEKVVVRKKMLLIPFYHEEKKNIIFNKQQNLFWGSLLEVLPKDGQIILPVGDILDLTDIGNKDPSLMTPTMVYRLKARYDVTNVMLAVAHVGLKDQSLINVELYEGSNGWVRSFISFDASPEMAGKATIAAVQESLKAEEEKDAPQVLAPTEPEPVEDTQKRDANGEIIPESSIDPSHFSGVGKQVGAPQSVRDKMIEAARRSRGEVVEERKPARENPLSRALDPDGMSDGQEAVVGSAKVSVFFTTIDEWISMQKDLSRLRGIKGIQITTLKTNQADIVIEYNDWQKLLSSLGSSGLQLSPQSEDTYILKRLSDNF